MGHCIYCNRTRGMRRTHSGARTTVGPVPTSDYRLCERVSRRNGGCVGPVCEVNVCSHDQDACYTKNTSHELRKVATALDDPVYSRHYPYCYIWASSNARSGMLRAGQLSMVENIYSENTMVRLSTTAANHRSRARMIVRTGQEADQNPVAVWSSAARHGPPRHFALTAISAAERGPRLTRVITPTKQTSSMTTYE